MEASRILTAVVARSMVGPDAAITTPQLRLLVLLERSGPTNLSGLASATGVDTSTASRTCEQLVQAKLVSRTQDRNDRRNLTLRLSHRGANLVARLMTRRRQVFSDIADDMNEEERAGLVATLGAFIAAAERTMDRSPATSSDVKENSTAASRGGESM